MFEHLEQDLSDYLYSIPPNVQLAPNIVQVIFMSFLVNLPLNDCFLLFQRMSEEILTGISFLHSHRIVHRDLKPQNLLVSSAGHIKVADFGLAKTYDYEMKLTSVVVTLWYRPPEILLNQKYTSAVDVWSVACIVAEMCQVSRVRVPRLFRVPCRCVTNSSVTADAKLIKSRSTVKTIVRWSIGEESIGKDPGTNWDT